MIMTKRNLKLIINAKVKKLIYKEEYNMENEIKIELIKDSNLEIIKLLLGKQFSETKNFSSRFF